jgi:DNA-binding NarL/FixJ family response regulator
MPEMNGYEASSGIKTRRPDCRVIAFSVHSYPEAREKARRAGADDFIEKGAPLSQILQKIKAR